MVFPKTKKLRKNTCTRPKKSFNTKKRDLEEEQKNQSTRQATEGRHKSTRSTRSNLQKSGKCIRMYTKQGTEKRTNKRTKTIHGTSQRSNTWKTKDRSKIKYTHTQHSRMHHTHLHKVKMTCGESANKAKQIGIAVAVGPLVRFGGALWVCSESTD